MAGFEKGESGNPNGRPKLTLDDLPEGWAEQTIALYSEGGSDIEVRATILKISSSTWERFLADEPLFSETVHQGRALAEAWWTQKGRSSLDRQYFQNGTYALHMKNRFRWTDRQENDTRISGPNGGPIETKHSGSVAITADLQSKSVEELTRLFTEKLKDQG